jgi:hypothetical protein
MIFWIFIIALIIASFFLLAYYKKQAALKVKIAGIKAGWGKPDNSFRDSKLIAIFLKSGDEPAKLSPGTADDLDLDNIFAYIDRTYSRPGQQYLYKKLHNPETSLKTLLELDEKATALAAGRAKQERIALELSKLNTVNAYYLPELFAHEQVPLFSPLLTSYIQVSGIIMVALLVLLIQIPNQFYFLALIGLALSNTVIHYKNKAKIAQYTHSLPQLLVLNKVAKWLAKNAINNPGENICTSLKKVDKLKRSLLFVSFQNGISGDPTDFFAAIFELIKTLFLLESVMFITSLKRVNRYRTEIRTLYNYVAETDVLIAINSVREGLPYYVKPNFSSELELNITGLYHPLVTNCVPNAIHSHANKGVLITGSNMSGKTTFIRAVAINTLLAQTIYTCCAQSYAAPLLKIYTSIRVNDDIEEHKSYFQAEALSVLKIVNECGIDEPVKSLVIIDEIFRGTNTIERIAAAKAVLAYLTANNNFVFVSTHDLELAELLGNNYAIYSFEELVADTRLVFDYKMKEGLLKNKNGIAILASLGYPPSVVDDANMVSEQMRNKYQL